MQHDERQRETPLTREITYECPIFTVERWQVALHNGHEARREVVRHVGAAAVVALDPDGIVTLVTQYRVPMDRVMLEIPAGKKDSPDEDPLVCARRELAEETGLRAETWQLLTTIDTSPGFLTEQIGLYLATGLTQGDTHPDEDELLGVVRMPLKEAVSRVMAGEITDSKTICGLMMAWQRVCKGGASL